MKKIGMITIVMMLLLIKNKLNKNTITYDFLYGIIWTSPSQSELSPILCNTELTHLGSKAFISILMMTQVRECFN